MRSYRNALVITGLVIDAIGVHIETNVGLKLRRLMRSSSGGLNYRRKKIHNGWRGKYEGPGRHDYLG